MELKVPDTIELCRVKFSDNPGAAASGEAPGKGRLLGSKEIPVSFGKLGQSFVLLAFFLDHSSEEVKVFKKN